MFGNFKIFLDRYYRKKLEEMLMQYVNFKEKFLKEILKNGWKFFRNLTKIMNEF